MKALNLYYTADPDVLPFMWDHRIDLGADDDELETVSDGVFYVVRRKITRNQVAVIGSIVPYMMQRQAVGTPGESVAVLPATTFDGLVSFNVLRNNLPPFISELNYNASATLAGAQNSTRAEVRSGIAHITSQAVYDAQQWNPLFRLVYPSEVEFAVTFQIIPQDSAAPLPVYPYRANNGAGPGRIDWVGVVVAGVLMPQSKFDNMVNAAAGE